MSNSRQVEPVTQHHSAITVVSDAQFASNITTDSTPAKKKFGSNVFTSEPPPDFESVREQLSDEMNGRWVGAMPVQEFLDKFLPTPPRKRLPKVPDNAFNQVPQNGSDRDRYEPFMAAISRWMPGLKAVDTSNTEDTVNKIKLKTDISIYKNKEPVPEKTDFSEMELWIEFKSKNVAAFQDPSNDTEESRRSWIDSESFVPDTQQGKLIRGQLSHYAGALHSQQFRNFSFSILVDRENARLLRWDPSGAVVTAAFNYREQPKLMAQFFWRYNHLSPKDRGHDPTVRPAILEEEVASRVRKLLGKNNDTTLYRYELPGMEKIGYAYGPKPPMENRSLVSRFTRNLPVIWIPDKEDKSKEEPWYQESLVYMKDTWRFLASSPDLEHRVMPEHEIYEKLHECNTPNIPKHVVGSDIDGGRTETQNFANASWVCVEVRISPYQHYRLFHGVVGRALYKFTCTRQLVQGVFDALQAHSHAFVKAKILHRDISAGNIILTNDGRGLLIDWELARTRGDTGNRRPDRTGTWQFMSANLLQNPGTLHKYEDDLESFLHVLAWITLRYVPANDSYSPSDRQVDLTMFDEVFPAEENLERGGLAKAGAFLSGHYPSPTRRFHPRTSTPLLELLSTLQSPFKSLYGPSPSNGDRKKITVPRDQQDDELIALRVTISKYDKNRRFMETAEFFLDKMESALKAKDEWPNDDEADPDLPIRSAKLKKTKTTQHESSKRTSSKRRVCPTEHSGSIQHGAKRSRRTPVSSQARN